jgi:hypothetical protein
MPENGSALRRTIDLSNDRRPTARANRRPAAHRFERTRSLVPASVDRAIIAWLAERRDAQRRDRQELGDSSSAHSAAEEASPGAFVDLALDELAAGR